MVFGGSTLSQHSENSGEEDSLVKSDRGLGFTIPLAPDGGCQAVVVRTGYGTIQVDYHNFLNLMTQTGRSDEKNFIFERTNNCQF
jgi:hypothetical protein